MTDQDRTFWDRVREAVEDAGFDATQTNAAKLIGVSQPSISDWNKPGKGAYLETAIEIAKKFGVCVEWLYTGRGPKRPGDGFNAPDDPTKRLLELHARLTDENRRKLLSFGAYTLQEQRNDARSTIKSVT